MPLSFQTTGIVALNWGDQDFVLISDHQGKLINHISFFPPYASLRHLSFMVSSTCVLLTEMRFYYTLINNNEVEVHCKGIEALENRLGLQ